MGLADRIIEAISASKLKRKELALRIGVAPSAITAWTNGDTKNLKAESLFGLERESGLCAKWILFGKGPKRPGDELRDNELGPVSQGMIKRLDTLERAGVLTGEIAAAMDALMTAMLPASRQARPRANAMNTIPYEVSESIHFDPEAEAEATSARLHAMADELRKSMGSEPSPEVLSMLDEMVIEATSAVETFKQHIDIH